MTVEQQNEIRRITNENELHEFLNSSSTVNKLILVHVELDGVTVCHTLNAALLTVEKDAEFMKQIVLCRLNADDFYDLLNDKNVNVAPTILFYHRNEIVDRVNGFNQSELLKKIKFHANNFGVVQLTEKNSSNTVELKVKQILNSSPVLLFMKGTPASPQCGFSRQACHLLAEHQIKYDYFDVLADQNIREELKRNSNINNYPQFFVEGKLIGDLDAMSQMFENEEFRTKLKETKAQNVDISLENLIRQAPLMLFIKGTPEAPRCGFTKELLNLLAKANVTEYKTFDILSDENVRQKLKEFSSWQTYPQIYFKGNFIGGLDVLKQMQENGTLVSTLTASNA